MDFLQLFYEFFFHGWFCWRQGKTTIKWHKRWRDLQTHEMSLLTTRKLSFKAQEHEAIIDVHFCPLRNSLQKIPSRHYCHRSLWNWSRSKKWLLIVMNFISLFHLKWCLTFLLEEKKHRVRDAAAESSIGKVVFCGLKTKIGMFLLY